jgi:hypothetical protein
VDIRSILAIGRFRADLTLELGAGRNRGGRRTAAMQIEINIERTNISINRAAEL